MSIKLRDLIRQVRACKTSAEERAVIAKESAMIRTAIREEQVHFRHRNVAKLLFMHMLGYPTHFGQLECMKLIASSHFPEKRIGYLGIMLLLSEETEVLMLSTNALKNDLNSDNKFVSGLALCAVGNLATTDMSRDLVPEVDKHLKSNHLYLRKKACLATARCLSKCPDMVEDFVDRIVTLLKDGSIGVLVTVVQLMTQVLTVANVSREEESFGDDLVGKFCQEAFLRLVPSLVKILKNLTSRSYSTASDHDGSSNPILQVEILALLRLLGTGNKNASNEMNDILAQVATSTDTSRNSGNAILYECVKTIMAVESEENLMILAVNILGQFLLNRDNNIRYVALNTLSTCIIDGKEINPEQLLDSTKSTNSAVSALQYHRTTIVDCMKDPDISIRQRALELIYQLVNRENVEGLTAELLNYLVLCPREHRADICNRILRVVEKLSPDDRWRIDTLITMLTIAGRESSRKIESATIIYISRSSEDLRAYSTHRLLKSIRDDDGSQHSLLVVGIWCIGEYGDLLLTDYSYATPSLSTTPDAILLPTQICPKNILFMGVTPDEILTIVQHVIIGQNCTEELKCRALTCFVKLSCRFATIANVETLERLHNLTTQYSRSHILELQLRSCEYDVLINAMKGFAPRLCKSYDQDIFGVRHAGVTNAIADAAKDALSRMPIVDLSVMQQNYNVVSPDEGCHDYDDINNGKTAAPEVIGSKVGDILDLEDIFSTSDANVLPAPEKDDILSCNYSGLKSDLELLSDIFSAPSSSSTFKSVSLTDSMGSLVNLTSLNQYQARTQLDMFKTSPTTLLVSRTPQKKSNLVAVNTKSLTNISEKESILVLGFTHNGLEVEFECRKPDIWNEQKSSLTAKLKNTTDAPFYNFSLQCAVPKYVKMELKPSSSMTIPVTEGRNLEPVTQIINVTNMMLGKKKLMLKLKVNFTSREKKIEHITTCSDFPMGKM